MRTVKQKRSRPELWNPETIKKLKKSGRGTGIREFYRPWLTVQDVPSRGISTRIKTWKYPRLIHLLSRPELYHFLTCEWNTNITDFREQFPLKMEVTEILASEIGADHPSASPDDLPIVMTTDALLTFLNPDGTSCDVARSIKPAGSWTLGPKDLILLDSLVAKLSQRIPSHAVSQWLFKSMSRAAKDRILSYKGTPDPWLHQQIVREINRILRSGSFFDAELFAKIYVSPDTWQEVQAEPRGVDLVRLNRRLLMHAFGQPRSPQESRATDHVFGRGQL
jgi:hypothetical protein